MPFSLFNSMKTHGENKRTLVLYDVVARKYLYESYFNIYQGKAAFSPLLRCEHCV